MYIAKKFYVHESRQLSVPEEDMEAASSLAVP